MFDKLRGAFSSTVKSLGEKELKEKDVENALSDLEIALLESDVAIEVIDSVKSDLKEKLIGLKIDKNEIEKFVRDSLISIVSALFDGTEKIDLFERINEKKKMQQPFLILFVGINGVGKTTSLAKVAHVTEGKIFSRCGSIRYI
jgi:fused signal recognition particle receptor